MTEAAKLGDRAQAGRTGPNHRDGAASIWTHRQGPNADPPLRLDGVPLQARDIQGLVDSDAETPSHAFLTGIAQTSADSPEDVGSPDGFGRPTTSSCAICRMNARTSTPTVQPRLQGASWQPRQRDASHLA